MNRTYACAAAFLLLAGCGTVFSSGNPSSRKGEKMLWTARAFPSGHKSSSAVLVERGIPAEVPVNQPCEYEIVVTNLTKDLVEDVVLTEYLAESFAHETSDPSAAAEGGALRWSLGTLGAGEKRTLKVKGTPRATGEMKLRCEVGYRSLQYGKTSVVEPKLALVRSAPSDNILGDPIELRFTVSNPGTGKARNVVIAETLPDGLATLDGANTVRIEVGELRAGASREYVVRAKAARTSSYALRATASAEGGLAAESAPVNLVVTAPALTLAVEGPSDWVLDRPLSWTVTLKNTGDGVAKGCQVRFPLPAGARFESATEGGSVRDGAVQWTIEAVKPGEERKLSVTVTASEPGTMRATASAKAHAAPETTATLDTKLAGISALLLEVLDTADPIPVGNQVTYEITVRNQGSATATNIVVSCELEPTMEFVSGEGSTKLAAGGGAAAFETLPSLERGQSAAWKVVVKALQSADVRFKVKLTSDQLGRPVEETESTTFFQ
ncbi:MAG: hypothetical protein ACREID_07895 [Planctomycetota bacterium]